MARYKPLRRSPVAGRIVRFQSAMLVALMLAGLLLITATRPHVVQGFASGAYAIKDAQIITGTGKMIAKGTVVIRDGLITEVGESVKVPADAHVIDGAGLTVYPGLIDAMSNLGLPAPQAPAAGGGPGGRQAALAAAVASGQQPNPDAVRGDPSVTAADQVKSNAPGLDDARNVGITSALSSPKQGIFSGQSAVINLAGDDSSKMVVRAPVALTVQFTTSGGFFSQYPNSLMGTVAYIRQTFYDAMHYRDEMTRYNRVKRGVERPTYDKKLAALQSALNGDMPVMFVANSEGDIRRSLIIANEFKLKPIIAGALYAYRVLDMLKGKNIPVILSVDFPKRPNDLPEDEEESLRALRARAESPKGAAMMAQAGIKFAFTSGTLRPADFIANVQRAIESGLPKDQALRAMTVNAAEILGTSDQLGSIEVGKIANLVVASGDLLAKDAKVRHVFIDGDEVELKKPEAPPTRAGGGRQGGPGGGAGGGATARAVDPSGDWSLTVNSPQGEITVKLTLHRDGEQVSGSITSPMGVHELRDGHITGNAIRANANVTMEGNSVDITILGTVEGDNMHGTITIPGMGSFDFSGTRPR